MSAGWMRRCASLNAMRRISCIDQRISGGSICSVSCAFFLGASRRLRDAGWRPSWKASMTSETWRCQPCQDRVSLWSRPNSFFRGLKAILDGPAMSFDLDQHLDACSGRTPSGEERHVSVGNVAADQQAARPKTGERVVRIRRCRDLPGRNTPNRAGVRPFVPSPADKRCHREASMAAAICSAVPPTGGLRCQERK